MIEKIKRFKIIVFILRLFSLGYSHCGICGLPWKFCKEKDIWVKDIGYFATCKYCWNKSDLNTLTNVYIEAYNKYWYSYGNKEDMINSLKIQYNKDIIRLRQHKIKYITNNIKK